MASTQFLSLTTNSCSLFPPLDMNRELTFFFSTSNGQTAQPQATGADFFFTFPILFCLKMIHRLFLTEKQVGAELCQAQQSLSYLLAGS